MQKIYDELKDKGLEMIAVNYQANDTTEKIVKFARDRGFGFKIVLGGGGEDYALGKLYGVQAYPTNYLLDATGKVVWRETGFNEKSLREALTKMGVK